MAVARILAVYKEDYRVDEDDEDELYDILKDRERIVGKLEGARRKEP